MQLIFRNRPPIAQANAFNHETGATDRVRSSALLRVARSKKCMGAVIHLSTSTGTLRTYTSVVAKHLSLLLKIPEYLRAD
jgi:hypothetical protein